MIVLKAKAESSSSSPINLSTPDEKSSSNSASLSFGELLRGEGVKIDINEKITLSQKGTVVLALDDKELVLPASLPEVKVSKDSKVSTDLTGLTDSIVSKDSKDSKGLTDSKVLADSAELKSSGLLALLKGDAAILGEEIEALELHPKITENMSVKEIKVLVKEAKNYLKDLIIKSDGYKQSQIKDLPQTLKGLAQLAKKFDIDISKITLQQVKSVAPEVQIEINTKKTTKATETAKTVNTAEVDDNIDVKIEQKLDKKTTKISKPTLSTDVNEEIQKDIKKEVQKDIKADARVNDSIKVNQASATKDIQTPIFKAQSTAEIATTEQVVQAKQFKAQPTKTPKDRADETLKLLLRGEKPSPSAANVTADFSVTTAKVIAPRATTDAARTLESLLRGDSSGQATDVKTEQVTTHKADSFEVKLNEAKQMVKYLSTDVKQAIDDYKSPFTRVKVQLNPQKLGEIELTVVQRGKNLHVNISSNNVAVNALATNLNELKTQLSNNGINNATFNFNSGSESGSSSNEQHKNRQQEQQDANEEYNYFENEEQNEEILSSLEIVVPSYA